MNDSTSIIRLHAALVKEGITLSVKDTEALSDFLVRVQKVLKLKIDMENAHEQPRITKSRT